MRSLVICLVLGYVLFSSVSAKVDKLDEDERILEAIKKDDAFQEAMEKDPFESFEEDLMLAEADDRHFDFSEIAEKYAAQSLSVRKIPKRTFKGLLGKANKFVTRVGKKVKSKLQEIGESIAKAGKQVIQHFQRRTVCYPPFGCFNNSSPWNMVWNFLPERPCRTGTKFILYTRENEIGRAIHMFDVDASHLSVSRKTIFLIHGWKETQATAKWVRQMKDELLKRDDFNVIGVYWGIGARKQYFQAAGNTRLVGAQIAYLIQRLHNDLRLCYSKVHLIGFSLGAQVAGFAGKRLREKGHVISRITGLDPAGPVFAREPSKARLDSTDARFVDVIHTSFLYFVGIKDRSGDIDFYVNGGGAQPGCGLNKVPPICSHIRAVELFIKSINPPCDYRSYECSNYTAFRFGYCKNARSTVMGYDVSKGARGKYYLQTSGTSPFCCKWLMHIHLLHVLTSFVYSSSYIFFLYHVLQEN
ncbi:pancreatic lipase-related protein 2-like isoform X1 [Rhopilema esculentum]|uniref:pancreatic lipase-related protein 2-like isoform X1 n=1 Tax=Rhopilema esculentum TaxID=499914 RepID=UPI0031D85D0E